MQVATKQKLYNQIIVTSCKNHKATLVLARTRFGEGAQL